MDPITFPILLGLFGVACLFGDDIVLAIDKRKAKKAKALETKKPAALLPKRSNLNAELAEEWYRDFEGAIVSVQDMSEYNHEIVKKDFQTVFRGGHTTSTGTVYPEDQWPQWHCKCGKTGTYPVGNDIEYALKACNKSAETHVAEGNIKDEAARITQQKIEERKRRALEESGGRYEW